MQIAILIEPTKAGRFRASSGEPLAACAEGESENQAAELLQRKLEDRLRAGAHLSLINLADDVRTCSQPKAIQFEPLPDDDWFFKTMREAIAEQRQREEADS